MPQGKIHVTDGEEALDIIGEEASEGHVGTESRLLNAYDSPVAFRGQNENRAAARLEEHVSENCSEEETSLFVHIEVYASVCSFLSISISDLS